MGSIHQHCDHYKRFATLCYQESVVGVRGACSRLRGVRHGGLEPRNLACPAQYVNDML